uniref:Conserved oligomeric Golgi complex subunit 6 n=1 Tax=Erpetoichthys calabaricus TaxID=27687 RepID=A0A8C4T2K3_ERPCA
MADTKVDVTVDASNGNKNAGNSGASQQQNPLSRKLNKILETRLDNDKEMLEALKALSAFFVENSLRTRRNLRGDIEKRSLSINEEFVRIFKDVKEELEGVHEDVQAMSRCCEDMTNRLKVKLKSKWSSKALRLFLFIFHMFSCVFRCIHFSLLLFLVKTGFCLVIIVT